MLNKIKIIWLRIRRKYKEFLRRKFKPDLPFRIATANIGDYKKYGFPALPKNVDHEDILARFEYKNKYWIIIRDE